MFYSRICILTDEAVTEVQMDEFKEELGEVMKKIFGGAIEIDLVLDVLKKKGIVPSGGLDEKEMDDILENFDLLGDTIC